MLYTDIVSRNFFRTSSAATVAAVAVAAIHPQTKRNKCAQCVFGGGIILHETYERAIPAVLL